MEKINCSICNHNKYTHYLNVINNESIEEPYELVKCNKCTFIYLNPRLNSSDISAYYNTDYNPFQKLSFIYRQIQNYIFRWKRYIIESDIKEGNLLDIGSGNNSFTKYMTTNNWFADSYDNYSSSSISDLSKIDDNYYDVITLWHSLEHIYNLHDTISSIKRILKKNGMLYIACPNIDSIDSKLLGNNWIAYDPPRHIYHFSYNTMEQFLDKSNITIVRHHRMIQDLFFNVLKTKKNNIIYKAIILIISFILIILFKNYTSSYLFVCKKK